MYVCIDYIETHLNITSLTSGSFMDWFCLPPCVYLVFSPVSIKTMWVYTILMLKLSTSRRFYLLLKCIYNMIEITIIISSISNNIIHFHDFSKKGLIGLYVYTMKGHSSTCSPWLSWQGLEFLRWLYAQSLGTLALLQVSSVSTRLAWMSSQQVSQGSQVAAAATARLLLPRIPSCMLWFLPCFARQNK